MRKTRIARTPSRSTDARRSLTALSGLSSSGGRSIGTSTLSRAPPCGVLARRSSRARTRDCAAMLWAFLWNQSIIVLGQYGNDRDDGRYIALSLQLLISVSAKLSTL